MQKLEKDRKRKTFRMREIKFRKDHEIQSDFKKMRYFWVETAKSRNDQISNNFIIMIYSAIKNDHKIFKDLEKG